MAKDWVERVFTGILIVSILAIHFFIGDFLFGRHEVETYTVDCEVLTKCVKDGKVAIFHSEMMTYTGIASLSMKCGGN